MQFFAERLPAGTQTLTYTCIVVTPGTFTVPPTKVYSMPQPEVLGLSTGAKLVCASVLCACVCVVGSLVHVISSRGFSLFPGGSHFLPVSRATAVLEASSENPLQSRPTCLSSRVLGI